jgi:hypothetical protein
MIDKKNQDRAEQGRDKTRRLKGVIARKFVFKRISADKKGHKRPTNSDQYSRQTAPTVLAGNDQSR